MYNTVYRSVYGVDGNALFNEADDQESAGWNCDASEVIVDKGHQQLSYVEWLERRRGSKRQAVATKTSFQPVSCATVSNYLNSLVAIVKFQLRHQMERRDPLLDQLRNLRSQAESYSMAHKKFEKVHPEWCSWQELQVAREKCRAVFDEMDASESGPPNPRAYLLQLRELCHCLLCLFTICPPPRCSVIRLLEWDKTLVRDAASSTQHWLLDLTDVTHAATRHKTHKRKGAMQLPLPRMLSPYLAKLKAASPPGVSAVFPPGLLAAPASPSSDQTDEALMDSTSFAYFVKRTFRKYTEGGQAPNPSLLRSIFTTWLYSLRYDTEDGFLQQIKASSAKWKAHSERVAGAVYNKELVYQKKAFSLLLRFCEEYAARHAYDRPEGEVDEKKGDDELRGPELNPASPARQRRVTRKRSREVDSPRADQPDGGAEERTFTVEELIRTRLTGAGVKQVLVRWEGYRRPTWETFDSIQEQLPEMLAELEAATTLSEGQRGGLDESLRRAFFDGFIIEHRIDEKYRWLPDRLNVLEHAAGCCVPPIQETADQLRRDIMTIVRSRPLMRTAIVTSAVVSM